MKKKMKFPDGSVREIDEADVATARSLGAVDFTEPSPVQKNGKKVFMQFQDGQTKEIDSADVAVAESLGAVKKKEDSGIGADTSSQPTDPFSLQSLSRSDVSPLTAPAAEVSRNPYAAPLEIISKARPQQKNQLYEKFVGDIESGDPSRVDTARNDIVAFQAETNPSVITPADKAEIERLTGVTDPASQLQVLQARIGKSAEGMDVATVLNPLLGVNINELPEENSEKLGAYRDKLDYFLTNKKDTRWSNKNVVSIGGRETTELENFLNLLNPMNPKAMTDEAKRFHSENLNDSFSTGLESIKETQKGRYDRITKAITNNEVVPTTDIVELTSIGSKIINNTSAQDVIDRKITADEYVATQNTLSDDLQKNVYDHPDFLRILMSDVISKHYEKDGGVLFSKWMVTDKEIDAVPLTEFAEAGLDHNNPEFKKQLSLLKEKEGWMPFQNSIAKDDLFREFKKGAMSVPKGALSSLEAVVAPDEALMADKETQQFNVSETANRRGKYFEDNYGVLADAANGFGQFASQLAAMYAGSSLVGAAGKALGGGTTASELLGASSAQRLGNLLINSKDLYATYGVPFTISYGDYYKDAISKGANPLQAKMMAFTNASMEGVSETIFDNLAFGRKVAKDLFDKKNYDKIAKIFDRGVFDEVAQKEYKEVLEGVVSNAVKTGKNILKAGGSAAKESFEEVPVALTNFVVDAAANPANVEGRDVVVEMKDAFLDGLVSFSIPSLIGLGGSLRKQFNDQKPMQESLMVAAMERPYVADAINRLVEKGEVTQDEANKKLKILNTAAETLQELPKTYTDGTDLSPQDREAYLSLSVKEKVLDEMSKRGDKALKNIAEQEIEQVTKLKEGIITKKPVEEEVKKEVATTAKTPEQKIVDLVNTGAVLGGAEMAVKADPTQATEALRFIAQQAYGITETGEKAVGGIAEIENKEALAAAKERFPSPESTLIKEATQDIPARSGEDVESKKTELDNKYGVENAASLGQLMDLLKPRRLSAGDYALLGENRYIPIKNLNAYQNELAELEKQQTPKEQPELGAPISFNTEQADKILQDSKGLTASERRLPREVIDPVNPTRKKMSIENLRNRAETLKQFVNCLSNG